MRIVDAQNKQCAFKLIRAKTLSDKRDFLSAFADAKRDAVEIAAIARQ